MTPAQQAAEVLRLQGPGEYDEDWGRVSERIAVSLNAAPAIAAALLDALELAAELEAAHTECITRLVAVEAERDALVARDVSTMPVIAEARRMVERNMPGCGGLEVLLQRMDTESASRRSGCAHDARTKEAT